MNVIMSEIHLLVTHFNALNTIKKSYQSKTKTMRLKPNPVDIIIIQKLNNDIVNINPPPIKL
mgnify:CR=1 FL=1